MIKKIFKVAAALLLFLIVLFTAAILWPLPEIRVPEIYESTLIKSIDIIDVKSGNVLRNRDILIGKNRITEIDTAGNIKVPESVYIINGYGKYLLPGLWNMHTHSSPLSPWLHHPLYIANGVTGVRDMSGNLDRHDSYWAGTKDRQEWNEALNNNDHVGPRYVLQSSFQINGKASPESARHRGRRCTRRPVHVGADVLPDGAGVPLLPRPAPGPAAGGHVMEAWFLFWTVVLYTGITLFALMSVYVIIWGFRDIKLMLREL